MAQIGSLSVKLGLVTVGWDQATDKAKQQAKQLQKSFEDLGGGLKKLQDAWKTLGGSVGVGSLGLGALIAQTASFADKIDDLAKGFGVSTGFALQFSHALQQAGSSGEAAGKIIGKLFENIESAKEGNQQAVDGFRRLGIGFDEIKRLTPEDAIRRVIDALSQIQDPIERAAQLRKQLGKGGLGLDLEEVNSIIKGGVGGWQKYGDNLERVSKIKDNLTTSLNNLMIAFSTFIGPLARDGTVSVEKFQGALAGVAVYFAASRFVAAAQGFMAIASAIKATTAAAVAFNVATIATPIGALLKLAAAGTAFLIYQRETKGKTESVDDIAYDAMGNPIYSGASGSATPKNSRGKGFDDPRLAKSNSSSDAGATSGLTAQEIAAGAALAAERIKTANAEALAGIPIWDEYSQKVAGIGVEASNALAGLNTQRAQLQNQYKDSPILLGIELSKLHQQEKQIIINRDRKLAEARITKDILDTETERVRQEGYLQGKIKLTEDLQKRRLATNKAILDTQIKEIDYATELLNIQIEQNMALNDNEKARAKQTVDYQASIEKLRKQLEALPSFIEALPDEELSAEAEANNNRIIAIQKQMEFEKARHDLRMGQMEKERTFEYGLEKAVNQILDRGTNAAQIASDMANSVFGNMEAAIDNFVKTGKFAFGDFAKSVIRDLIAIQMKAQAVAMLRMATGGGGGIFGSLFGGGFKNDAGGMEVAGSLGFADGGDPPVGKASLVGERGPELFVPKSAGTIIPNHSLAGMMGGGQTINYNGPFIQSMNAIDTQSGIQFLSRNKQAVWAANQSAQRSLPVSK